jgi:hypothetical protein
MLNSLRGFQSVTSRIEKPRTTGAEAVPKFAISMRIDGEDVVSNPSLFRWSFRQRAIFFADTDPNQPRFSETIASVECEIGSAITTTSGSIIGIRKAFCPDPNWSYEDENNSLLFPQILMNGEYNDEKYYYSDITLQFCQDYEDELEDGMECASPEEVVASLSGVVDIGLSW